MTALTPNRYDSGFADKARGMVQHTEDGFEGGTIDTFMNPSAQVSAFFSVDELGNAHQYLPVGHGYVAWAEEAGNPNWRSCECEDKTKTGIPMPAGQVATVAQIFEACATYDDFPLQSTDDPVNGHGLITHGDGGVAWGNHPDCPGSVRKAQRPAIIALAQEIRKGAAVTTPAPQKPPPPPGQWFEPGAWTWKTVSVTGTGEDGKAHSFELQDGDRWVKVA